MDILTLLVTIIVAALVFYILWFALSQIPLPQPIRTVVVVLFILVFVVWIVQKFGLL